MILTPVLLWTAIVCSGGCFLATLICCLRPARRNEAAVLTAGQRYEAIERAAMPGELRTATLIASEMVYWRRNGRPFPAKVDQVFLTRDDAVVMVETKTRSRITPADIIQVTCQAMAFADSNEGDFRMATYAYIRLQARGRGPTYERVNLFPAEAVDSLWSRWQAVSINGATPITRPSHRCQRCPMLANCLPGKLRISNRVHKGLG